MFLKCKKVHLWCVWSVCAGLFLCHWQQLPELVLSGNMEMHFAVQIFLANWTVKGLRQSRLRLRNHFLCQCHMGFTTVLPFRRPEAVLSLFILKEEVNMITDYDKFFPPVVTKVHILPFFHRTRIF